MIKINDKTKCSGCCACVNICENKAIKMIVDDEGFWYPQIKSNCNNCGKCEDVCPIINKPMTEEFPLKTYAAYNKNENVRLKSSSGGIFTLLAEYVLAKDGVVFGAAFEDDCRQLKHIAVSSADDLEKLRGSKYLQSDIGESYSLVKKYLNDEKPVLFTGTPCQINGLVKFLGRPYDNLFLQDLICHGVPSPLLWNKYLDYIEENEKSLMKNINFRDKASGWNKYSVTLTLATNEKISSLFYKDKYMKIFLRDSCLRPSCYNCEFKGLSRVSDITLGDFWGVEQVLPQLSDNKGVSSVFVNSLRGQKFFDEISRCCYIEEVNADEVVLYNSTAVKSVQRKKQRDTFFIDLKTESFDKVLERYSKDSISRRILNFCIYIKEKILK